MTSLPHARSSREAPEPTSAPRSSADDAVRTGEESATPATTTEDPPSYSPPQADAEHTGAGREMDAAPSDESTEEEGATDADAPPARSRGPRRALGLALFGGAVGAALALIAAGQTWSEAATTFAQGKVPVSASGGDVTGLPSALALVGLAALVAVFAVRRAGRFLVAGLLTLCGLGVVVSALTGLNDHAALQEEAAEKSGLTESTIGAVTTTPWPYVSAVGGLLLLGAGLLALVYGRKWPSMSGSSRYERLSRKRGGGAEGAVVDPERPEDLWKALDRGEDPT